MIAIDPIDFIAEQNRETILQSAKEQNLPVEVLALKFLNDYYTLSKIENVDKEKVKTKLAAKLSVNEPAVEKVTPIDKNTPLADIDFGKSTRVGPLEKIGIKTLGDLLARDETTLGEVKGLGQASIDNITSWCWENNFDFTHDDGESSDNHTTEEENHPIETSPKTNEESSLEEPEDDSFDFEALPDSVQGIKDAGAEFSNAWGLEGDKAKKTLNKICTEAGFNPDNVEGTARTTINAIRDRMPVTVDQYARVVELGQQLGESEQHVTVTRPEALCGKALAKMNRMEANTLIEELEEVGDDVF